MASDDDEPDRTITDGPHRKSSSNMPMMTPGPSGWQNFLFILKTYRYLFSCLTFGAITVVLGLIFCFISILFRRQTSSLHLIESLPLYMPGIVLCCNGASLAAFSSKNSRRLYLIKSVSGLYVLASGLLTIVALSTGWIHLPRLRTHPECAYNLPLRACTCTNDHNDHFTMESVADCDLIHGLIYHTLRVIYALSLFSLLISLGAIITLYKLFQHQKEKSIMATVTRVSGDLRYFLTSGTPTTTSAASTLMLMNNQQQQSVDFLTEQQQQGPNSRGSSAAAIKCLSATDFSSQDLLLDLQQHYNRHHHPQQHNHPVPAGSIQENNHNHQETVPAKIWSSSGGNEEIHPEIPPRSSNFLRRYFGAIWRRMTNTSSTANTPLTVVLRHNHPPVVEDEKRTPSPPRLMIRTTGYSMPTTTTTTTASLNTSSKTSSSTTSGETSTISHRSSSSSSSSYDDYHGKRKRQKLNQDDEDEDDDDDEEEDEEEDDDDDDDDDDENSQMMMMYPDLEAGFLFDEARTDFTSRSDIQQNKPPEYLDLTKSLFPCIDEDVDVDNNYYLVETGPAIATKTEESRTTLSTDNLLRHVRYLDPFAKTHTDDDDDIWNHQQQSTWTFEEAFKNYYDSQNRISGTMEYWNTLPLNRGSHHRQRSQPSEPAAPSSKPAVVQPSSATTIIIEPPVDYRQMDILMCSEPEPVVVPSPIKKEQEEKLPGKNIPEDDDNDDDDEEDEEEEDDDGAGDTSTSQDLADFELELDDEPIKFLSDDDFTMFVAKQAEIIGDANPPVLERPIPPARHQLLSNQLDLMAMMVQQQRRITMIPEKFGDQDQDSSSSGSATTPTTSSSLKAPTAATTRPEPDEESTEDEEHSVETAEFIKPPTPFTNFFV